MSRPGLALAATLVALTCGLAAFLVPGSSANTQAPSASSTAEVSQEKPITGTLSKPDYTVIALAADGLAETDTSAADGSFSISPPVKTVSLHLRAPEGTYAGPVVLEEGWNVIKPAKKKLRKARKNLKRAKKKLKKAEGKAAKRRAKKKVKKARKKVKQAKKALKQARNRASGRWAIIRLRAGAKLGNITVRPAAGYAKVKLKERQWNKWVIEKTQAQAKDGVPIGAGNFGRVRSSQLTGSGVGDLDRDGISDPLDIDDDGDLVLDNNDTDSNDLKQAAVAAVTNEFVLSTGLIGGFANVGDFNRLSNVNAGMTDEELSAAFVYNANFFINLLGDWDCSGGVCRSPNELDCGGSQSGPNPGLVYCSQGGTGQLFEPFTFGDSTWQFPECCDADGDGFGEFTTLISPGQKPGNFMNYFPKTTSDQISPGDLLIQRVPNPDGTESEFVATVQYVFVTNPALVSYDDGQGNSATPSYPLSDGLDPGSPITPFPVKAGPGGDVVLDLTLWRPQRRPSSSETGDWIDIGGLNYRTQVSGGGNFCPQSAFSSTDPNLRALEPEDLPQGTQYGGMRDLTADRATNPDYTLTYQLNVTECLESIGSSFEPGETTGLSLDAAAPAVAGSSSDSQVWFQRVP